MSIVGRVLATVVAFVLYGVASILYAPRATLIGGDLVAPGRALSFFQCSQEEMWCPQITAT